jgi:hypothetical protein
VKKTPATETNFAGRAVTTKAVRIDARAEYIGQRHDPYTISRNLALEVRLQHIFMNVRNGRVRYNLRYEWFKIRTTNGIDVF